MIDFFVHQTFGEHASLTDTYYDVLFSLHKAYIVMLLVEKYIAQIHLSVLLCIYDLCR